MIFFLGILVITVHFFLLSKLQFSAWPELLSYPYLFLNGFELYKDFIMPYPPGLILYLASIFKLSGFSPEALKNSFWLLVLFTDIILFATLYIQRNSVLVVFFLLTYILLQPFLDGNMLWFDYATVLPVLIGYIFFISWLDKRNKNHLLVSSAFLSLAILVKQISFVYFVGFTLFYFFVRKRILINELKMIAIGFTPVFIFFAYLLYLNNLEFFWNWVIYFPLFEWSKFPGYLILHIDESQKIILSLLFAPVAFILFTKKILREKKFLVSMVFLFSAIFAIYPRFSFFHFQTVLAFLIIIFFQLAINLNNKIKLFFLLSLVGLVFLEVHLLLPFNQWGGTRFFGDYEKHISEEIKQLTNPSERIFLFGPPSSIYADANRIPPKNWADNFGWYLEIPGVQEWAIEGLKKTPPKYIFYQKPQPGNWFDLGTYKPKKITDYMKSNYNNVGNLTKDIEIWTVKK